MVTTGNAIGLEKIRFMSLNIRDRQQSTGPMLMWLWYSVDYDSLADSEKASYTSYII